MTPIFINNKINFLLKKINKLMPTALVLLLIIMMGILIIIVIVVATIIEIFQVNENFW